MTDAPAIPVIDIAALFGGASPQRAHADEAVAAACRDVGFLVVTGLPHDFRFSGPLVRGILSFFRMDEGKRLPLARRKYAPAHSNIFRGYFPVMPREIAYKEGYDMGLHADETAGDSPLYESNPWPADEDAPGWQAAMRAYGAAAEAVGFALLDALARGLGWPESSFSPHFVGGGSTLRILRYPVRPPESWQGFEAEALVEWQGRRVPVGTRGHTDSGCMTLLAQDGVGGLQVELPSGRWADVPTLDGSLVINLGDLMERWSGGAYRATRHRVLAPPAERFSIPFFFEPRYDTVVEGPGFPPIRYDDHLRVKYKLFTEFNDVVF